MSLPSNRSIGDHVVDTRMADVSTPSSAFASTPFEGRVNKIYGALQSNVTGTSVISLKINGTTLTGLTLTVSGNAGATFQSDENASATRGWVLPGDKIEFVSDGGSSNVAPLNLCAVIAKV